MRIVILYNEVSDSASASDRDVLVQRDAISAALDELGHQPTSLPCSLNLEDLLSALRRDRPDLIFNLVESLGGTDRLMGVVTLALDAFHLPYTGCATSAILLSGDKLAAKRMLRAAGLPTPGWIEQGRAHASRESGAVLAGATRTCIIKAIGEHASVGLEDDAVVVTSSAEELRQLVRERSHAIGHPCFAERYIEGREFNLSLLDDGRGRPEVLPPAEILFEGFPPDRPRIVGYRAKWAEDSTEYFGTPRRFDFPATDAPLLHRLSRLARRCWRLFGLRGYARVDFRVDAAGRPWILEVNANPCLSPDAGFAAALQQAGIPFPEAVRRIVTAAV
jgi:D-alanine-D-alanine ligase